MDISALKTGFDALVTTYGQMRRQVIPCFDDFYQTAIGLIPYDMGKTLLVGFDPETYDKRLK